MATIFCSSSFLNDIVACDYDDVLDQTSNGGGELDYSLKSTMKMFLLDVYYYYEHSLVNIISLFDLICAEGMTIKMDSEKEQGFCVFYNNLVFYFAPFDAGKWLYYYDTSAAPDLVEVGVVNANKPKTTVSPYSFVQTVNDNKAFYTDCEMKGVENAWLQQKN